MRDRFGGGDEVAKAHPLVGRRPFLVDADIARTILHGRDTEHFLDDIAVTDIAEPPIRADHSRLARGQSLALRQRGDERVVRRTDHRPLIPGLLGAARGDFEHAIECGVILLDARQQPLEEPGGLMYRFLQCTAAQYMTRDVATVRARRRWMREQGMSDPARLVFVDETAANTKMVRLSGRCPRGERLIGRVPQGHWKTITFVAALRRNGMRAPCTVDGSMNGAKFLAYVEQCLAPTLKRKDIVMIDNLPAHKAAGIREAIEARGATLRYLPQYSPDLNPIEMPFSKLKASLRKAAERTIPRLRRRIARFTCTLAAREACNYFRHAGYK